MANEEQVRMLKQSIRSWNMWRYENPDAEIDLSYCDLSKANLAWALLRTANLTGAILRESDLTGADLATAKLSKADLKGANLLGTEFGSADLDAADLGTANLTDTDFRFASLSGADMSSTKMIGTRFNGTYLSNTNFSNAVLSQAEFVYLDLSQPLYLETVQHGTPSSLGTDTLLASKGKIPLVFLRGCGLSDWEIESARLYDPELNNEEINKILYRMYDLRATQALQISPLFISYSHGDGIFVDKLESYLNHKGVRFWRDVHDAKAGRLETQIDRAMRLNPTVLLILSEHSLQSDWVEHEVRTARGLEKEMGRDVLCPIALDDSWKSSPWPRRVMEQVMEYNILDFSAWNDDSKFGNTFNKLIDGLQLFYKG